MEKPRRFRSLMPKVLRNRERPVISPVVVRAVTLLLLPPMSHADPVWQFETKGMIAGNPVISGDRVFVSGGSQLYSLDKTGALRWAYDAGATTLSTPATSNDAIFLLADNGLHAIDTEGKRLWLFESSDAPLEIEGTAMGWGEGRFIDPWSFYRSAPLVVSDKVIFGNRHGTFAVDAKSGSEIWHADTGTTHTKPAAHDGIIVVGSWDNNLYGLRLEDGSLAWKVRSRLPEGEMAGWLGWEGFNLDPVIHDGIVYVGNRGTYFYAINAPTGIEKWSAKHPTSWVGSPALVSDGVVYFGMSDGYCLVGLEVGMGNQSLLFRNRFYNYARPQANDSRVFMASLSGELFSIDKLTGNGTRIFVTPSSKENLSALQSDKGGLDFLYSKDGYTHENATRDVKRMLSELDSLLSLTLHEEILYAGSAKGILYAIPVR